MYHLGRYCKSFLLAQSLFAFCISSNLIISCSNRKRKQCLAKQSEESTYKSGNICHIRIHRGCLHQTTGWWKAKNNVARCCKGIITFRTLLLCFAFHSDASPASSWTSWRFVSCILVMTFEDFAWLVPPSTFNMSHSYYPLGNLTYIAIENDHLQWMFPLKMATVHFSTAMLNYQRIPST